MFRSLRSYYLDESNQDFKRLLCRLGIRIFERASANEPGWLTLQNRSTEEAIMHAYLYELAHRVQLAINCPDSSEAIRFAVEEDALPMFEGWKKNGKISAALFELNLLAINRLLAFDRTEAGSWNIPQKNCA